MTYTTITDAYNDFVAGFGSDEPLRTESELRDLIHAADLRYEEIGDAFWELAFGRVGHGESWAYGEIDWPLESQWDAFTASENETSEDERIDAGVFAEMGL